MPINPLGDTLLIIARNAIGRSFSATPRAVTSDPGLLKRAATFVTLTQEGRLRGCIGSLEAHRPLGVDVEENALAAAFRDPRFTPLTADEFLRTRIEVSLLQAPQHLHFSSEEEALRLLRPGLDGLILQRGHQRATFLPQVWDTLPEPAQFLRQLKRKAGLPEDFWDETISLARYGVQKWKEE